MRGAWPEIDSVATFVGTVRKLKAAVGLSGATISPWFRGHSSQSWDLKPSIYRCEVDPQFERELIRDFRIAVSANLVSVPNSDIDWLFLAQHHGLPTRILDWSENPLVALYFSVEKPKGDGVVFIINPWTLNSTTLGRISVPTTMDKVFEDYVIDITHPDVPRQPKATLPMAFRPSSTFKRSIAQSGVFTIAGKSRDPLNRLSLPEFSVERLVVPERHKKRVLLDLLDLNISKGSLFGDYDSIAQSIRYRYSKEYLNAVS